MEDEKTVLISEATNKDTMDYSEENTENIINRKPIWKSPKFIIVAALCLIAVIVAVTIVITSAGGSDDDIAHKLETAQKYLTEMKYDEAKAIFEEIIETDPKCEEAYIGLADAYMGLGKEDKAVEVLEKAMDKIGETSDLKRKLNEVEKKQKEKDKEKETETTEDVTTNPVTEPEGDVTTENDESTEEQDTTTEGNTTIETDTTSEQRTVINQQQATTGPTQPTTQQQTTTTQPPTTTQSQPETLYHSTDEQNKIIDMYAEAICNICDGGYVFGVDSIEVQDITGDGIDDLYVTCTVGRGTDGYWLIYANSSVQKLGGGVNATGWYYFEYYRNVTDNGLLISQVTKGTDPFSGEQFEYRGGLDFKTDGTALKVTYEDELPNGYTKIEKIEEGETVSVDLYYEDCSVGTISEKIKQVWSYE